MAALFPPLGLNVQFFIGAATGGDLFDWSSARVSLVTGLTYYTVWAGRRVRQMM